jgi:rare lipoprotein A (peptidoglycan hydrolase)
MALTPFLSSTLSVQSLSSSTQTLSSFGLRSPQALALGRSRLTSAIEFSSGATASLSSPEKSALRTKSVSALVGSMTLDVTSPAQNVASVFAQHTPLTTPAHSVLPVVTQAAQPTEPLPSSQVGWVSWYGSPAGTCASPWLPFGTVVHIAYGGVSTTCVVDDRGPYLDGRILDLSPATFSQLAWLGTGVIDVTLSW